MLSEHADGAGGEGGLLSALGVPYRAGGAPGRYGLTPPSAQPGRRPLAGGGAVLALRPPPPPCCGFGRATMRLPPPPPSCDWGGVLPAGGGADPSRQCCGGGRGGHCSTASQLIAMQCATDSTALFVSLGGGEGSKLRPPRINTSPSLPPSAAWPRVGGRRGGSQERMQIPPPTLGSLLPSATAVCPKGGGGRGGLSRGRHNGAELRF